MANSPDPNKVVVSAQVDRETEARLCKLAKARQESRSTVAASVLRDGTANIPLDPEDYERIAADIRAAKGRKAK